MNSNEPLFKEHDVNIYNRKDLVEWATQYLLEKFWAWYYTEDKSTFKWFSYEEWLENREQ